MKSRRLRSLILTYFIFLALFSTKKHSFIVEGNASEKVVIVEQELDGI